ncbi:MAG: hypothetical protein M3250_02805 [Thermoproteota archaeon]|jgi:hypothetical protein|nr:hypothetical protein [Thermoproteota archaeon]
MELKKRYQKENNDNDQSDKQQKNDDQPRAIKIAEELQQEERESEQVELDPHEVLEEEEKIQPQSQQE